MNTQATHIIEKVRVKLTTPTAAEAYELKENFSAYFADYVLPFIENYLDEFFKGKDNTTIRVNQLKLSLKLNDILRNRGELINEIKKRLDAQLKHELELGEKKENQTELPYMKDGDTEFNVIDSDTHYFEALVFFLTHGSCPWWLSNDKLSFLLEEKNLQSFFKSTPEKIHALFAQVIASPIVRKRLVAQFSFRFLIWLMQQVFPEFKKTTKKQRVFIETEIRHLTRNEYSLFFQSLVEMSMQKHGVSAPQFQHLLRLVSIAIKKSGAEPQHMLHCRSQWITIISLVVGQPTKRNEIESMLVEFIDKPMDSLMEVDDEKEENHVQLPEEGLYVDNAGMVLLHPFLKHFFTNAGLLENGKELADKELAVQLLHFIATGKENDWEHTMLFEKFLCNMPLDSPLIKKSLITKKHKKEVTELLNAVLENWKALGNSSIELLRNEFLSRPGKLFQDNVSPRLVVERKTQDILLDRISWNISIVKLPWSKQILYATW